MMRDTLPTRPIQNGSGIVIAILGVDGSGKSSIQRALCNWLREEGRDVVSIYFGSGDGPMSASRKILSKLGRARHQLKRRMHKQECAENNSAFEFPGVPVSRSGLRFILDSLFVSSERKKSASRMRRAKQRGAIVVTDRFPQVQNPNGMDGPRLHHLLNSHSMFRRGVAKLEQHRYEEATTMQPDLAIALNVSPEVSLQRADHHSIVEIRERIKLLKQIQFPSSTVIHIDANQEFECVLREAKACITGFPMKQLHQNINYRT
jgi:thymidylate kinase